MPLYEYRCRTCDDVFELRRPVAESSEPATCPSGHPEARRVLSAFMALTPAGASASGSPGPGAMPSGGCGSSCGCAH